MKIMKKVFALVLTLCMAATLFTGCQSKSKDTAKDSDSESDKAAVTSAADSTSDEAKVGGKLVIWDHTAQFDAPLKAVIEGFNQKYPDVEVEYQIKTADQYYNLLQTAMQAGEAPDLFWTNGTATTNYASYIKQGLLMDISDKVDFSLYNGTNAMNLVTVDDKVYSTPTAELGGRAVFYNKDIFTELGLQIPKTFSEFEKTLETIKKSKYIPISFCGSDPWAVLFQFEPVLAGMSLDWINEYGTKGDVAINDKRVTAAYNKMLEWAKKGYYGKGYLGVDESGALLAFSKGDAAMCIEGTWNIQTIQQNNPDLNFGAFQIPCEDGSIPFVGTGSVGYSVSANTENTDAAIAFENYFASKEAQAIWIKTLDSIPCSKEIQSENPVVNDITNFTVQAESFYSILGYLAKDGESPTNVWQEDQTKVFSGGLTPEKFTDELEKLTK